MRRIAIVFAAAALIACGQPPSNASADSAPPPVDGGAQIRELMARIEAYRAQDFIRPAAPSADGERSRTNFR